MSNFYKDKNFYGRDLLQAFENFLEFSRCPNGCLPNDYSCATRRAERAIRLYKRTLNKRKRNAKV